MMIDSRKSRYQSHNERTLPAEVNKKIAKHIESRAIFVRPALRGLVMNSQTMYSFTMIESENAGARTQFCRRRIPPLLHL
jgi:hypothetical protein